MRPHPSEYPPYFEPYVSKVEGDDLHTILPLSLDRMKDFLAAIPEAKAGFSYAPGKWTVKEVLQHCIDTERIFAYRALCLARGEQQPLPGFDQDLYAGNADVKNKSLQSLKDEMLLVRQSTLLLLGPFTSKELNRSGTVSSYATTVLALGFNIAGHWLHHQTILTERYGI